MLFVCAYFKTAPLNACLSSASLGSFPEQGITSASVYLKSFAKETFLIIKNAFTKKKKKKMISLLCQSVLTDSKNEDTVLFHIPKYHHRPHPDLHRCPDVLSMCCSPNLRIIWYENSLNDKKHKALQKKRAKRIESMKFKNRLRYKCALLMNCKVLIKLKVFLSTQGSIWPLSPLWSALSLFLTPV